MIDFNERFIFCPTIASLSIVDRDVLTAILLVFFRVRGPFMRPQ